jgi:hypothetical protein
MRTPTRLMADVDNEGSVAWLDGALEHAYMHGQMKLLAYLEAVMEEVLFEEEPSAPSQLTLGFRSASAPYL